MCIEQLYPKLSTVTVGKQKDKWLVRRQDNSSACHAEDSGSVTCTSRQLL